MMGTEGAPENFTIRKQTSGSINNTDHRRAGRNADARFKPTVTVVSKPSSIEGRGRQ